MYLNEEIQNKWAPVLNHEDLSPIKDTHKRSVIATLLENTERELMTASQQAAGSQYLYENPIAVNNGVSGGSGNIATFDPVLISLVRRAMPNLIAYDICGVQPMTGPTGLIFAMRSQYGNTTSANVAETFYNEVNTAFGSVVSGANTIGLKNAGNLPGNTSVTLGADMVSNGLYNYAGAMSTAQAEALGTTSNTAFPQMGFTIEKVTVTAQSRALKLNTQWNWLKT